MLPKNVNFAENFHYIAFSQIGHVHGIPLTHLKYQQCQHYKSDPLPTNVLMEYLYAPLQRLPLVLVSSSHQRQLVKSI